MFTPSNPKPSAHSRIEELNKAWGKISGMQCPDPEKEALMKARISRSGLTTQDATALKLQGIKIDPKVEQLWKNL
jgi:hypothetical protein